MRRALLFTMTAVLFFMVTASTEASEGVNAMKEISVRDFANLAVGNAENKTAGTGCTVLLFKGGAPAGLSVMGGGPASRESELLKPTAAAESIHAILLSGGKGSKRGQMKMVKKRNKTAFGTALIILAGIFWGSMGIFVRRLAAYGFSPIQIVCIRVVLAALAFSLILLVKDPAGFMISRRDLPLFLGLGLGSVLVFTVCYFTAISMMSLSTAAILLYTSPIWIMLMSALFFHEKVTARKILALLLAFGGCVLVSGLSDGGLTIIGLLIGLGSGIGYGLYSILGTIALRRHSPYTVTTWTFLSAALGSLVISHPGDMAGKFLAAPSLAGLLLLCLLTALITAVIPFLSYTLGLRSVEASKAGILATIEPMVATLIGVFVFSEPLTFMSGLGILLILAAVVILNVSAGGGERS